MNNKKDIRDFFFRGLMFESEATKFQIEGIQIGTDASFVEEQLLNEGFSPFSITKRNSALEMARLYSVLHCVENKIRDYNIVFDRFFGCALETNMTVRHRSIVRKLNRNAQWPR